MLRFVALGDALLENPAYRRWEGGAVIEAFRSDSIIHWLRDLCPDIELDDADILAEPRATTVTAAARIGAYLDQANRSDGALILLGLQDCFAMMEGTAPPAAQSIAALQTIIDRFIGGQIRPFVIVPPPCRQFVNGLFADRYLAISASLRRMARQRPGMTLIDTTDVFLDEHAKGIEPADGLSSGDDFGHLAPRGALLIAGLVAKKIGQAFGLPEALSEGTQSRSSNAINPNPLLAGSSGILLGPAAHGVVPDGFTLDTTHGGGMGAAALASAVPGATGACLLTMTGSYRSDWPFVRLHHDVPPDRLHGIDQGEEIEAVAEFEIPGDPGNLAFAALQMTPVWSSGYAGLLSGEFAGAAVFLPGTKLLVRTPRFRIQERLTRLGLTFLIYFMPGSDLDAEATLFLRSIVLRKTQFPLT